MSRLSTTRGQGVVFILNACLVLLIFGSNSTKFCEQDELVVNRNHTTISNPSSAIEKNLSFPTKIIQKYNKKDISKPFLVIHVGPSRTGSTALQVGFKQLEDNGVFAQDGYMYDRKDFFDETFMNQKCQKKLLAYRTLHKDKGRQHNLSEDLGNELKLLPCWKNAMDKIEPFRQSKTNLFASYEGWSFKDNSISIESGESVVDWESMRIALTPDWNILLVFSYRRYPEWLFSSFYQLNRPTPKRQRFHIWPGAETKEKSFDGITSWNPLEPLPMSRNDMIPIRYRYSNDLKQEMERNPEIPYAIFNVHSNEGFLSSFVCDILPNTYHSCKYAREQDKKERERDLHKSSQTLFYDALAMAAYEAGLINGTRHERLDVADAIRVYHKNNLKESPLDFPLVCPPKFQLNRFLNLSLSLEEEIVPEFAKSPGVMSEHRSRYWEQVASSKFCWIDTGAVLNNSTWDAFFGRFQ